MISMLIYSCKQDEMELLQGITKDVIAYQNDESLNIMKVDVLEELQINAYENIDVAYVDITIEHGLQAAKEIRSGFPKAEIMIISDNTISPMMYLTPDVKAASLLLKPLTYHMAEKGIRELLESWSSQEVDCREYFSFEDEKEKRRIPYSQILYFEAKNRRVYIRVQSKEYGIYGALDTLEEELPKQFRRCHRSYIINTSYISKVWYSKNSILLKNDEEMPLSRSYKTIIKEAVNSEN